MRAIEEIVSAERCFSCGSMGAALCSRCVADLEPATRTVTNDATLRVIAPLAYEGPARSLVLALKLRSERGAAAVLARYMTGAVREHGLRASVLTWVPGRRADIRRRGYDHAALLAEGVARSLGLPLLPLLERTGASLDQSGLGRSERWSNVSGAFTARTTSGPVAVIDDLVTSGATASAVAAVLRSKGASGVEVLAACRAERSSYEGPSETHPCVEAPV